MKNDPLRCQLLLEGSRCGSNKWDLQDMVDSDLESRKSGVSLSSRSYGGRYMQAGEEM